MYGTSPMFTMPVSSVDSGRSIEKGLLNQTIQLNQGLCGVNQNIQQTGAQIANGISNLGFTIQQQFCNTNSLIEANNQSRAGGRRHDPSAAG